MRALVLYGSGCRAVLRLRAITRVEAEYLQTRMRFWWWLIPVLLLSFWLGAHGLDADAVWHDEYLSLTDAGGPMTGPLTPAEIWTRVATTNAWHTPGFFIVLNGWAKLVGWSPAALRAMSLLFGILAIAWTYRLGSDMLSPRVGLYAAIVLGTSAFFVHFLHELRMYTMVAMFTAFTIWAYFRLVRMRREPLLRDWLFLFGGSLGLLYTHYFAALPLGAVGLYHLLFVPKNRRWRYVFVAIGLAGVLFVPWLGALLQGLKMASSSERLSVRAMDTGEILQKLIALFSNETVLLCAVLLAFAVAALLGQRRGARQIWFLTAALFGLILVGNTLIRVMHSGRVRYLIPLWPLLAILVGLGLVELRRRLPGKVGSTVALLTIMLWGGIGAWRSEDIGFTSGLDGSSETFPMNKLLYAVRPHLQPEDVVIEYLQDGSGTSRVDLFKEYTALYFDGITANVRITRALRDPAETDAELAAVMDEVSERQRVWVTYSPVMPRAQYPEFEAALSEQFYQCPAVLDAPQIHVDQYARTPVCCLSESTPTAPRILYGDGIGLLDTDPLPQVSGDVLPVSILWSLAPDVPPQVYSVALHVMDAQGNKVAQADYGLNAMALTCQQAQVALPHLPAGEYQLRAGVYAWTTGQRLPGFVTASGEQGDMLPLGTFVVVN
jgi:hypothetical protein